jgi:signal transduction histidine kinase
MSRYELHTAKKKKCLRYHLAHRLADFLLNVSQNISYRSVPAMGNGLLTMNREPQRMIFPIYPDGFLTESVVDSLSSGVIFSDGNGILTFMNRKAETLLNVFKETVIGKRIDMLPLRTPLYKVMSEDCRDCPLEMNIFGRIVEVRSSELLSPDNEILGTITELFDVTAERQERRKREEFVAKMTHDLKSPLMVMQGYMQAMKLGMWGEIDSNLKKILDDMSRSGKCLCSMIEDLLDVYRLEMGLVQIKRRSCDAAALLERCCHDRRMEADECGVTLELVIPRSLPEVDLDEKQFSRVLANIIGNAVKFTSRHGRISITALLIGENLHIAVQDTGIGISENDLKRIFMKYHRAENAAGFKGSGLGLTLSKEIVEAHGGTIDVVSSEGDGSTFTIIIPIREQV